MDRLVPLKPNLVRPLLHVWRDAMRRSQFVDPFLKLPCFDIRSVLFQPELKSAAEHGNGRGVPAVIEAVDTLNERLLYGVRDVPRSVGLRAIGV